MRKTSWVFGVLLAMYGAGSGAFNSSSRYPDTHPLELAPLALLWTEQGEEGSISADDHAASQREKYVDELSNLVDQDSNLRRQEFTLMLQRAELARDLVHNRLEGKWLRVEQDNVKRDIARVKREQGDFEKKDARRKDSDQSKLGE